MRTLRLSATLMLLGSLTLGMAELTVDEQISAITAATPQERVRLVNEFKTNLSTMSAKDRAAAMKKFRSKVGDNGEQLQIRDRDRDRSRIHQMDETQERQENQKMNQNRTGSQYMQQNPDAASNSGSDIGGPRKFMNKK